MKRFLAIFLILSCIEGFAQKGNEKNIGLVGDDFFLGKEYQISVTSKGPLDSIIYKIDSNEEKKLKILDTLKNPQSQSGVDHQYDGIVHDMPITQENKIKIHFKCYRQGAVSPDTTSKTVKNVTKRVYIYSIGTGEDLKDSLTASRLGLLNYPSSSAREFADNLYSFLDASKCYAQIGKRPITGTQATKNTIITGNNMLNLNDRDDRDVVVLFFSGHGVLNNDQYVYICYDSHVGSYRSTAIRANDIATNVLNAVKKGAQIWIFIDTCNSSSLSDAVMDKKNDVRDNRLSTGGVIVCPSLYKSVRENDSLGHSDFAYDLINGLKKGSAVFIDSVNGKSCITTSSMSKYYLNKRVSQRINSYGIFTEDGREEDCALLGYPTKPERVSEDKLQQEKYFSLTFSGDFTFSKSTLKASPVVTVGVPLNEHLTLFASAAGPMTFTRKPDERTDIIDSFCWSGGAGLGWKPKRFGLSMNFDIRLTETSREWKKVISSEETDHDAPKSRWGIICTPNITITGQRKPLNYFSFQLGCALYFAPPLKRPSAFPIVNKGHLYSAFTVGIGFRLPCSNSKKQR